MKPSVSPLRLICSLIARDSTLHSCKWASSECAAHNLQLR